MMMEQLFKAEVVIFNRCTDATPKTKFRGQIKAMNRPAQIVYERADGSIDDSPEELPFDINAYGVGVMGQITDKPKDAYLFLVAFDTNKEMHEKLMNKVYEGLNDVAQNGPAQEDLTKVIENLYKKRAEQLEENSFWIGAMEKFEEDKVNIVAEYDEIVKSINPQTLADFAKEVLKGYKKEIVQLPTEK